MSLSRLRPTDGAAEAVVVLAQFRISVFHNRGRCGCSLSRECFGKRSYYSIITSSGYSNFSIENLSGLIYLWVFLDTLRFGYGGCLVDIVERIYLDSNLIALLKLYITH